MNCIEVCPVDAFYEGENMLVINPRECVDCGCCIDACPIDAIVFDDEVRANSWMELNDKYSKIWPNVAFDGGQTPSDAAEFQFITGKFERFFSPNPGMGDVGIPIRGTLGERCTGCENVTLLNRIWRRVTGLFQ
jgi:ferredoxin